MRQHLASSLSLALSAAWPLSTASAEESPIIAIPGYEDHTINYVRALTKLGANPVVVWDDYNPADFDGLLLPGGADVSPQRYGQENIACGPTDPALDDVQLPAIERFLQAGKPVLGICRGHQLLNVFFGGTLIQHLDAADMHVQQNKKDSAHATTVAENSFLASLYGTEVAVNSAHHQAVDRSAADMQPVQWCGEVIEAAQHRTLPVYSVQWHPERMCFDFAREDTADGSLLLAWFLEVCQARRQ